VLSDDYRLRSLVFGNESARILGRVVVNPDGSKTFRKIEIRPWDTDFNFEHKTLTPLEVPREIARRMYDPDNLGRSYQIQYGGPGPDKGTGRLYDDFTDAQLNAALRRNFVNPTLSPPGMSTSITGKPPVPFVEQQRQVPSGAGNFQATPPAASSPTAPSPGKSKSDHKEESLVDSVMQSPVRRVLPFSGGGEVTLPSGPHHYSAKRWIGNVNGGVTPEQAFESLSRHATPLHSKV
jgi:hypothetical protein